MNPLAKEFANPGSEFRGAPFWAWNGLLDPDTCRRQVHLMHDGGLGGFFMHSRTGLGTPYLSKEWFDCIDACVDEAKKLGMRPWLYDEDRWPSGAAGSLVTKDPRFRARSLFLYTCPGGILPKAFGKNRKVTAAFLRETGAIAAYVAKLDGRKASDARMIPLDSDPAPAKGESVIFAKIEIDASSTWYNGATYLDTLNPDATSKFIEITHDSYAKHLGKDLGHIVPGIFTDEPNHHQVVWTNDSGDNAKTPVHQLAWTDGLPAVFKKLAGYDILPRVLEIVLDVDGADSRRIRYDFNNCLTELFVKGFVKQIGDWCDAHKCEFTGHMLAEDSLADQTNTVGSCMRCYEYMQAPGMDMLTENWRIFKTAKQLSSAAHQFGKKWRLSETYGCTGWDFPFAGHKALGDWQFALGINLRCQHLAWYTMKGQAKRDYPAAIFYQSPWWNHYAKVEDYFARVGAAMTRGEEVRDILFIHPVESVWTYTAANWRDDPRIKKLEESFSKLTDQLLAAHLDFDYGDEDIIARHGKLSAAKDADPVIKIGRGSYKAVVVPSVVTLRSSTLALLKRFAAKGGLVVFTGSLPELVDAMPSQAASDFAATMPQATGQALELLLGAKCRRVSVADASTGAEFSPALYLLREDSCYSYLFICNTGETFYSPNPGHQGSHGRIAFKNLCRDRKEACDSAEVKLECQCAGGVYELDPETGAISKADASTNASGCTIRTSFPALGSRIFVIAKAKKDALDASPARAKAKTISETAIARSFEPRPSEANVIVLDHPSYRIDGGKWQPELEILRLDHKLRQSIGRERRGGHMTQPWMTPPVENPRRVAVTLKYGFDVEAIPSGDLAVCLESPGNFKLSLNGTPVEMSGDIGWWTDTSLRRIRLDPTLLRKGVNTLEAEVDFNENFSGLEIVYLLGSFGSKIVDENRPVMTSLPKSLSVGDLAKRGFAFYSGNMGYAATVTPKFEKGERVFVDCGEYRGTAVRVLVDGRPAGITAWDPATVEITYLVESGKAAEITLELLGNRRNSHGALHWHEQWPDWHGPNTFEYYDGWEASWNNGYNLVPFGLMTAPKLRVAK